ncbi:MAG: hypothetical protein ACLFWD_10820 [Anaerolineales bacterium]
MHNPNFDPKKAVDNDGKITVENINHPGKYSELSAVRLINPKDED